MSLLNRIREKTNIRLYKLPDSVEERKKLYFFIIALFFSVFVGVLSILNFIWLNKTVEHKVAKSTSGLVSVEKERRQADAINEKLDSYKKYRDDSLKLLAVAETIGRSPISEMQSPAIIEKAIVVPEFPPDIIIKALIIMDEGRVAVLNIEGEPPGQIYRVGASFASGKGKILDIDSKGVSWTWKRKTNRTNL
ncbi:MAG: hypothetical protein GXZ18_05820 [Synergistaceae bacterium]|nr:hypothetical protein [Synergistaceae bacterium]